MPKFRIVQYYTTTQIYEIEAENEDKAIDLVNGPNRPKPDIVTGSEFAEETVEEIDNE